MAYHASPEAGVLDRRAKFGKLKITECVYQKMNTDGGKSTHLDFINVIVKAINICLEYVNDG